METTGVDAEVLGALPYLPPRPTFDEALAQFIGAVGNLARTSRVTWRAAVFVVEHDRCRTVLLDPGEPNDDLEGTTMWMVNRVARVLDAIAVATCDCVSDGAIVRVALRGAEKIEYHTLAEDGTDVVRFVDDEFHYVPDAVGEDGWDADDPDSIEFP